MYHNQAYGLQPVTDIYTFADNKHNTVMHKVFDLFRAELESWMWLKFIGPNPTHKKIQLNPTHCKYRPLYRALVLIVKSGNPAIIWPNPKTTTRISTGAEAKFRCTALISFL